MTSQEAIEKFEKIKRGNIFLIHQRIEGKEVIEDYSLCDMAISALQAQDLQPTCNQLATDTISRQMAIDEWKNDFKGYVNALNILRDDYNGIMEYIDELPSSQQERLKGHWIDTGSGQECSECGEVQYGYDNFRYYCAKCGSDNRGK